MKKMHLKAFLVRLKLLYSSTKVILSVVFSDW
jgi:hypothetical protein